MICSRKTKTCAGATTGTKYQAEPGRKWCGPCLAWSRDHARQQREQCAAHDPDETCPVCRKRKAALATYYANQREMNLANVCRRNGITPERYMEMHAEQGGRCAICGQEETAMGYAGFRPDEERVVKRLAIDHCHDTGRARGLLCNNCNRAIGMFQDDPEVLAAAIAYLERHRA